MFYFKRYHFTLPKQSRSFTFLFMYLCEVALLVAVLLNTCRCSALSIDLFPFQSFFQCFRTPRVAVIVVDLSLFQSLLLWFAQYLESLCSLLPYLNCLNLSWFVLNTSSHSGRCSVASVDYLNTLTFVAPV